MAPTTVTGYRKTDYSYLDGSGHDDGGAVTDDLTYVTKAPAAGSAHRHRGQIFDPR